MSKISEDPVVAGELVRRRRLAGLCGGHRRRRATQVWVVRPNGSDARRVAGSADEHAELDPGPAVATVVVTMPSEVADKPTRSYLVDPIDGAKSLLAVGELIAVLDLSVDETFVIVKDGQRGKQFCVVVDRVVRSGPPVAALPSDRVDQPRHHPTSAQGRRRAAGRTTWPRTPA